MRASKSWVGVLVSCVALAGCLKLGSDDSSPSPAQPDARVGTGGSGPFFFDGGPFPSFDGGGGFTSDSGGLDGFVPGCGFCPPPSGSSSGLPLQGFVEPCCTREGLCGFASPLAGLECLPRDAPGLLDPTCAGASSIVALPGCCTLTGWCGLQVDELGLGCVRRSQFIGSPLLMLSDPSDVQCFSGQDTDAGLDVTALLCERAVTTGRCDPIATCTVEGGALQCVCPNGYADLSQGGQGGGQACRDINECLGAPVCPEGRCVNTPGSYRCEPIAP